MTPFSFNTTPRILCEPGASEKLAALAAGLGVQRPCLISDGGIAASGLLEPVQAQLEQASLQVTVFSDVIADPPEAIIHKALQKAVQAGCDGVIGFGGGSAMDTAKLIALLLDGSQSLQEVYEIDQAR